MTFVPIKFDKEGVIFLIVADFRWILGGFRSCGGLWLWCAVLKIIGPKYT